MIILTNRDTFNIVWALVAAQLLHSNWLTTNQLIQKKYYWNAGWKHMIESCLRPLIDWAIKTNSIQMVCPVGTLSHLSQHNCSHLKIHVTKNAVKRIMFPWGMWDNYGASNIEWVINGESIINGLHLLFITTHTIELKLQIQPIWNCIFPKPI